MAPTATQNQEQIPIVPRSANTDQYGGTRTPPRETVVQELHEEPEIPQLFSLSHGAIIVTGGARGLGITIAAACVEAGANVFCCDILPEPSQKEWKALKEKAKKFNATINYKQLDICDEENVESSFQEFAKQSVRPIVGVAHCAGVMDEQLALNYDMKAFNRVLRINVDGTMIVAKSAAHIMKETGQGGSILLIASISGSITNRGITTTAYSSSKAACHQMCRSLAVEWGQYGIRVNTLSPGYIRTAMTNLLLADKQALLRRWEDDNPLKRIGNPSELKGPAVYLLSNASTFMNGADLRIDGGHCAW
jgi:NAD(P)-dependent dehydrogenase (short-subunit alcohol dehydrogenase family)